MAETSNLGLALLTERAIEPLRDLAEAIDSEEAEHLRERLLGGRALENTYEMVLTLSVLSQAVVALEQRLSTLEAIVEDVVPDAGDG